MPGTSFVRPNGAQSKPTAGARIPPEILKSLPADVDLSVLEVPVASLTEHAIRIGDMLVLAPLNRTDLSDQVLHSRGIALALSSERKAGWRALGVLVAQFRHYGRVMPEPR
jgi:hypothetical protein